VIGSFVMVELENLMVCWMMVWKILLFQVLISCCIISRLCRVWLLNMVLRMLLIVSCGLSCFWILSIVVFSRVILWSVKYLYFSGMIMLLDVVSVLIVSRFSEGW